MLGIFIGPLFPAFPEGEIDLTTELQETTPKMLTLNDWPPMCRDSGERASHIQSTVACSNSKPSYSESYSSPTFAPIFLYHFCPSDPVTSSCSV